MIISYLKAVEFVGVVSFKWCILKSKTNPWLYRIDYDISKMLGFWIWMISFIEFWFMIDSDFKQNLMCFDDGWFLFQNECEEESWKFFWSERIMELTWWLICLYEGKCGHFVKVIRIKLTFPITLHGCNEDS